ncbi:hypothetical protein JCM11672_10730 [Alkaliphilus crotonatoxidans]
MEIRRLCKALIFNRQSLKFRFGVEQSRILTDIFYIQPLLKKTERIRGEWYADDYFKECIKQPILQGDSK